MKLRRSQLGLLIFLLPLFSASKEACIDFYECGACRPENSRDFEIHGLSRSALLEIGQPSSFDIKLYEGRDFIITCCTQRAYYPIRMRLLDDNMEVLYDNQIDDYIESVGFTLDETQTITIEATLLAEDISPDYFDENRSCTGVLIMWRKTPNIGF